MGVTVSVSYGHELNVFAARAAEYGKDWRGVVLCKHAEQRRMAAEDAQAAIKGSRYHASVATLYLPNGARLSFFVVGNPQDAQHAFAGREYVQIIWLTEPLDDEMRDLARSRLRSRVVPGDELRYEYALER